MRDRNVGVVAVFKEPYPKEFKMFANEERVYYVTVYLTHEEIKLLVNDLQSLLATPEEVRDHEDFQPAPLDHSTLTIVKVPKHTEKEQLGLKPLYVSKQLKNGKWNAKTVMKGEKQ